MKFEIKKCSTFKVLFETEADTFKEAVEKAVKEHADLVGADLRDADLRDADLNGADLRNADLRNADLNGADLRNADLNGADLRNADLNGADLRDAKWDETKEDMFEKMSLMPNEIPFLYQSIWYGKIDGSVYDGEYSCFCGTLSKASKIELAKLPIKADSNSPVEKFFLGIRTGDDPENNPISKLASEWIEEFCKEKEIKLPTRKVVWE